MDMDRDMVQGIGKYSPSGIKTGGGGGIENSNLILAACVSTDDTAMWETHGAFCPTMIGYHCSDPISLHAVTFGVVERGMTINDNQ